MKLYRNWIINEVARVMTKGEHTYVRAYGTPTTSLCEGINIYECRQVKINFVQYQSVDQTGNEHMKGCP